MTHICYHWRTTRQIHRVVSSCCATQRETKWQAPERRAKKYGPATIREAQIARSVWSSWPTTLYHSSISWLLERSDRLPSSKQMEDQSSDKIRRVLRWRKSKESAIFQWSNKLYTVVKFSLCFLKICGQIRRKSTLTYILHLRYRF